MRKPYPYEALCISSLEKVLPASGRAGCRFERASMLQNERFHFQVAVRVARDDRAMVVPRVDSAIAGYIRLARVALSPMEVAHEAACDPGDTNYIATGPAMLPDLLEPVPSHGLPLAARQWRCLWVTVEGSDERPLPPGEHPIDILFENGGQVATRVHFTLTVRAARLPKQALVYTAWMHLDSLMEYYGVEAFSPAHWALIENMLRAAARSGVNMALTPCFTPPLDTAIGTERPTVQLVDVTVTDGEYTFGFEKLNRFIRLCLSCGIERFEIAHLFTQWGAAAAPKIVAIVDGEERRIFGWETPADSPEYVDFLRRYLPCLTRQLAALGVERQCYFHISDEPSPMHAERYQKASELLKPLLSGFEMMDALSDYDLYAKGLVGLPVCSTHSLETFYEKGVRPLWTYYCGFSTDYLAMRSLSTPSARNRIFGYQLYRYDVQGFLHWGFNFYWTRHALYPIDPFRNTDGNGFSTSGDCFLVYPGADGHPLPSIRSEVFHDALQDLRALRALEGYIGRERVLAMIDGAFGAPLTMYEYPKDDQWLLEMRERVNRMLEEQEAGT